MRKTFKMPLCFYIDFSLLYPYQLAVPLSKFIVRMKVLFYNLNFTFFYVIVCDERKIISNKHNPELQRTDPGTKVTGEFSTRGHIFSPNV